MRVELHLLEAGGVKIYHMKTFWAHKKPISKLFAKCVVRKNNKMCVARGDMIKQNALFEKMIT